MNVKLLMILGLGFVVARMVSAQEVIDVFPGTDQISTAIMYAFPGDIIQLNEGDYLETQTLEIPIDLTIRGADGATVKWEVPTTVKQGIHVKANVRFENIIFHTDPDTLPTFNTAPKVDCIWNMYGNVVEGQEPEAEKNNIFIDHCQFIGFFRAVNMPERDNGIAHPVDTLYVTNSLFYGGGQYKPYRGVRVNYGQAKEVKIQDCTFWNMHGEGAKIYGYRLPDGSPANLDYLNVLIDHCTFYQMGLPPLAVTNGLGIYVKYTDASDTLRNCVFDNISDFGIKAADGNFLDMYVDYHVADPTIGWKAGCGVCQPYHYNLTTHGSHCIEADPMFVDPDNGDFRYQEGSLALTAADDGGIVGSRIQVWHPFTWDHTPLAVEEKESFVPTHFGLAQNFPNPFNPATTIFYSLTKTEFVSLTIYNLAGQKVRSLVDKVKSVGTHSVVWDGRNAINKNMPSGIYIIRLQAGNQVDSKKMTLVR